jgi:porphobilinogen synthase
MAGGFPQVRLRRLRQSQAMRRLVREVHLHPHQLISPLFVGAKPSSRKPSSLPGQEVDTLTTLKKTVGALKKASIQAIMLFVLPEEKDLDGQHAVAQTSLTARAIQTIKALYPECVLIVDACFCSHLTHGHCGFISPHGTDGWVDNDATLQVLAQQAVMMAQAGADVIAPSGMMDGMVAQIRAALDEHHFNDVAIMSYAVKYASQFYGPFRDVSGGAPKQGGSRAGYQMQPCQANEAIREADLDVAEGADFLMVKPAHTYLDIIYRVKQRHQGIPLVAYHVSGEYAMLHAAFKQGLIADLSLASLEVLHAIKRAGADQIITYQALALSRWLADAY